MQGRGGVNGKRGRVDLSGDAGFFANVGEIGGEAITEVDGGGGQAVVASQSPDATRGWG